jgi:hypothetical protein
MPVLHISHGIITLSNSSAVPAPPPLPPVDMDVERLLAPPPLEPAHAARLQRDGSVVVCVGVPPGTEVGIDMGCWEVGERFRGFKMVPPGVHYVYYR